MSRLYLVTIKRERLRPKASQPRPSAGSEEVLPQSGNTMSKPSETSGQSASLDLTYIGAWQLLRVPIVANQSD